MIKIRRAKNVAPITALSVPTEGGTRYKTVVFPQDVNEFTVDAVTADVMLRHKSRAFEQVESSQAKSKRGLSAKGDKAFNPDEIVVETEDDYFALLREVNAEPDQDKRAELLGRLNAAARHVVPETAVAVEPTSTTADSPAEKAK